MERNGMHKALGKAFAIICIFGMDRKIWAKIVLGTRV